MGKSKKEKELSISLELDNLLKTLSDSADETKSEILEKKTNSVNLSKEYYRTQRENCQEIAARLVDSITEFYLCSEDLANLKYVHEKNALNKITISHYLYQMFILEEAVTKLLAEIDMGNVAPRNFEVLGTLERSKMDIVKQLSLTIMALEQNYKEIYQDIQMAKDIAKATENSDGLQDSEDLKVQFKGTKNLLSLIRDAIPNKKS